MTNKCKMLITLLALMLTAAVSAQNNEKNYYNYPYGFVGVQGGVIKNYSGLLPDRTWSPEAALSLGYFFTPEVGTRLSAAGTKWSAEVPGQEDYDSKMLDLSIDLLLNFSNILFPNRHNAVNVIGVAGMPWQLATPHTYIDNYGSTLVQNYDKWNRGWKGGGIIEFDVAKHWGINLEAGSIYMHNRQHSVENKNRWWPYAMAGLTYKFGFKKKHTEPVVVEETYVPAPVVEKKAEPVVEKKPEPVVKEEPKVEPKPSKVEENIFFVIGKSDVKADQQAKIDAVAAWAKENPNGKIEVVGYADKGTGNAAINKRISERRAQSVKTKLVYAGVDAVRISTSSKGDSVQPFANNDDNRVVVIVGESK
ncbi:MAG: OmpA family protein [Prevotella sp.]|nr:OmpA family protein [Prevotella sp.]